MDSKVTIVIPNYNYAQYVGEAIESALAQTVPCETIVVDDGSTDNSVEIIKKYPVTLVLQTNKGLGAARNVGIAMAKGEYILPLDSDDKIDPTFVEKTIGKSDIVAVGMQEFGDANACRIPPLHITHKDFLQNNQIYCCSLFKKEWWKKVGGYREGWAGYEDWDLWLRMTYAGAKIEVVREHLFFYRKHGKSMITDVARNHSKNFEILKQANPEIYGLRQ